MLSMLFLNTLQVNANVNYQLVSQTFTFTLYPDNFSNIQDVTYDSGTVDTSGTISYSGSIRGAGGNSISLVSSGNASDTLSGSYTSRGTITVANGVKYFHTDLRAEFRPIYDSWKVSNFDSNYEYLAISGWDANYSSSVGSVINNQVSISGLNSILSNNYSTKSAMTFKNGDVRYYAPSFIYNGYFSYALPNTTDFYNPITFDVTVTFKMNLQDVSASYVASNSTPVNDIGTQSKLDDLNDSSQAIEESVTSDTGGGLLATIKSWFGSFFDNLIGVFVPEEGYFSDWFNRVNSLLSEKLGMLYAPFDLLISTLQAIYDSDDTENGIPFPGIKWEDTWLVEPTTFYFSSLGDSEGVTKLRDTVYFGTDVVLLFSFLFLLERKIKHILED